MCASVRVRMSVHACVRDVFAIYDDNILPRLTMIKINIIILYFIQIRHTDDFPSVGIPTSTVLGGCPFNGPLSETKYPTRAASPIKYNADKEPVKLKRLEP